MISSTIFVLSESPLSLYKMEQNSHRTAFLKWELSLSQIIWQMWIYQGKMRFLPFDKYFSSEVLICSDT